jgi:hypothetical protein
VAHIIVICYARGQVNPLPGGFVNSISELGLLIHPCRSPCFRCRKSLKLGYFSFFVYARMSKMMSKEKKKKALNLLPCEELCTKV